MNVSDFYTVHVWILQRTRDQIWLAREVSGRGMTYAVDNQFAVGSKDLAEAVMTVDGCS